MSKELKAKLRGLKNRSGRVSPDQEWVVQSKKVLLSKISNSSFGVDKKVGLRRVNSFIDLFVPKEFISYARPVLVSSLAFVIVVGGWIVGVSASQNSLPGDVMWGVKLAGEKTRLVMASVSGSKEKEVELYLEFASKRAVEIKEVVSKEETSARAESITTAVDSLKKSIESASKTLEDVAKDGIEGVLEIAENTDKAVEGILVDLEESSLVVASNQMDEISKVVAEVGAKSMEVLVEKISGDTIEEGVKTELKEVVKVHIENQLIKVAEDFEGVKNAVQGTSSFASSSTVLVDNYHIVSSTLDLGVVENAKDAEQQVEDITKQIETALVETRDLLESEDVASAFEKMKEVVITQDEISAVVDEAVKISEGVDSNDKEGVLDSTTSTIIISTTTEEITQEEVI
ncbi:MAG: DUF5667 domain-containing protein [Candidatus Magasanikbacteria bacterium]|nr:DUF5667 domain-containing protein [Candidatus Magasanikbacteria bacterium]